LAAPFFLLPMICVDGLDGGGGSCGGGVVRVGFRKSMLVTLCTDALCDVEFIMY
jgi:hypothetical protein